MTTIDPRSILAAGQDAALGLMTDTCRVEDVGEVVTSQDGVDSAVTSTVYEGPCRVKPLTSRAQGGDDPGPAPSGEWQYTVSLPIAATGVAYGQRLTILTSLDPSMPGRRMQVRNAERGSQISARRMRCAEVSR